MEIQKHEILEFAYRYNCSAEIAKKKLEVFYSTKLPRLKKTKENAAKIDQFLRIPLKDMVYVVTLNQLIYEKINSKEFVEKYDQAFGRSLGVALRNRQKKKRTKKEEKEASREMKLFLTHIEKEILPKTIKEILGDQS